VIADFEGVANAMFGAIRPFGRPDSTIPHAAVMETSMMLACNPDLVHMDRAEPGFQGPLVVDDVLREGMRGITHNGVLGDPLGATAEMGEAVFEALVSHLADQVRDWSGPRNGPILDRS